MSREDRISLLRRVSFCAPLDQAALAALAASAVPLHRPAGVIIQLEGDPAETMYVVVRGHVKITRTSPSGREQVVHIAGPGDHFNTVPMFDNGPCPANAEALTEVDVLAWSRSDLRRLIEAHPQLALALLDEFGRRLRHLVDLVDSLALHTVQGRLAQLLLQRATALEQGQAVAPLTQAEMAAQIGTVREMVARTLKSFEAQGLIRLERGTITILDRAGLAAQAEQ